MLGDMDQGIGSFFFFFFFTPPSLARFILRSRRKKRPSHGGRGRGEGGITYVWLALEPRVCQVVTDVLLVVRGGFTAGLVLCSVPEPGAVTGLGG